MDYKKVLEAQKARDRYVSIGILISTFVLGFLTAKLFNMEKAELIRWIIYGVLAFGVLLMFIITVFALVFTKNAKYFDYEEEYEKNKFSHWHGF